jgi:hypothetical protein
MKMAVFWDVAPCGLVEIYDVSETLAASKIRAITLVNFYQTTGTASQKTVIFTR